MQTYESGYKSTLAKKLDPTDNTMVVAVAPTVTAGRLFLTDGQQKERVKYTGVTGTTLTGLVRGLSQTADPSTAGTGLTWIAGTNVVLVAMHDQLLDKLEPQQNLQVAKEYATTAARDTALGGDGVAAYNYTDIKITATGLFYNYNTTSGQWEVQGTGTATPNASTTVAGSVEIATSAESIAGTDTGGTGALLSVLPSDISKNTQSGTFVYGASTDLTDTYTTTLTPALTAYTTGMSIIVKFDTANTGACTLNIDTLGAKSIKSLVGNDLENGVIKAGGTYKFIYDGTNFVLQAEDFATATKKGIVEMATSTEVVTGIDETRYSNPKDLYEYYNNIFYGTTNTAYTSGAGYISVAGSYVNAANYVTASTLTASHSGRFTITSDFRINSGNLAQVSAKLYVNGVLNQTKDGTYTATGTFACSFDNFIITKGDVIRLDVKVIQAQFPANDEIVEYANYRYRYNTIINQTFFS